jgi:histidinol phosphatase-like enzyme
LLDGYFTKILSPDSISAAFSSKAEGALYLCKKHALIPDETVLMGDSLDDLNAARAAGLLFLEAAYGYGKLDEIDKEKARICLKSPADFERLDVVYKKKSYD